LDYLLALKWRGLSEIYRVLKPGGHLVVVDLSRPTALPIKILTVLLVHEKVKRAAQDLPAIMKEVGSSRIESEDAWFRLLGFIRGSPQMNTPITLGLAQNLATLRQHERWTRQKLEAHQA